MTIYLTLDLKNTKALRVKDTGVQQYEVDIDRGVITFTPVKKQVITVLNRGDSKALPVTDDAAPAYDVQYMDDGRIIATPYRKHVEG